MSFIQEREIDRLEQRINALENDCEGLNRMLREHGYAQGEIDSYVAQCERIDALGTALRNYEAAYPHGRLGEQARALLHDSTEHEESGG